MIARRALLAVALAAPAITRGAARRVVCAGGAITECAFALGQGAQVVAVDSTSRFPVAALNLPRIGYMRALPPEGIVSLRPDLVLASSDAGPEPAIAVLRAAGVNLVIVPDRPGVEGVAGKLQAVGAALGVDATPVEDAFRGDAQALDPWLVPAPRQRVVFVLSLARGAPMVSGRNTNAAAMIHWSGGANAMEGFDGYKPLSAEAAIDAAPEVIMVMAHSLAEMGGEAAILASPQLAHTPAARGRRIFAIDGGYAIGWGPRAAHARRDIAHGFGIGPLPELPARAWV
jgi:iron complex transport system substrate-binding protein